MALGFGSYTRSLSRKRIVVSTDVEASPLDSSSVTPLKRMRSGTFILNSERSRFEALPQDILIRVLCGVDHEDLKQLFQVSKTIKEAALIAKQWHFEYSTPKKKTFVLRTSIAVDDENEIPEIEAPNAPMRKSKSRLSGRKLSDISVALFA
ncbi:F-box protein SKIP27-like [Prosopis cineraria]|uniref:F-box protein SKIP27-like n=1 Tax=Prosopis cineraria TaxID=364024 RepID=UPI0024100319|nr:F-box protein SKIP27-like [Prosopis cineraria]XP_054804022.1 F-box protein SKIP27-like [Prosopis cineraria]